MYCTNCGKLNPNDNLFCQYCGTKMQQPAAAAQPAQSVASAQSTTPVQPVMPAQPVAPEPVSASSQYAPAPSRPLPDYSQVAASNPPLPTDTVEVDPVVVSPLFANGGGPRKVGAPAQPSSAPAVSAPRHAVAQPVQCAQSAAAPAQPAVAAAPSPAHAQPSPAQPAAAAPAQPAAAQPGPTPAAAQPAASVSAPAAPATPAAPAGSAASSSAGLTGLSGAVGEADDPGSLTLVRGNGERLPVSVFPATVGKGSASNVRIANNTAVSRAHLRISRIGNSFMAEDLGSTNHTYVNGERIAEGNPIRLKNGDQLRLGDENITVEIEK